MYIMESEDETRRLIVQEQSDEALQKLLRAGLRPGDRVLDAGCGPGFISGMIADLVGPTGHVTGIDINPDRLAEASRLNAQRAQTRFLKGDVRSMDLPDGAFDFTWCQFVLEYLPDRRPALAELIRVTRPGGRLVLSEIDGFGLGNWPFSPALQESCKTFIDALSQTGFDFYVGRKLFTELRQAGLVDLRVHLLPQYVVAGVADARMIQDWEIRFAALEPVVAPAFANREAYQRHCRDYLRMLMEPDTLKFAVRLVTEGRRP
ncbi:methyltransferase domain-containing protein [Archangium lipolyticum]|uniref:methyltransferase domain-containing protein n=1 Tax=Archangium lipolyticum TaxID=2970465 RepID=UPI00214A2FE2|nr:methyltransferase domain-containing protein [Archangium lipolyticum]